MSQATDQGFDVAFIDKDDRKVVFVQVKTTPLKGRAAVPADQLRRFAEHAAYFLTIDPKDVILYQPSPESLGEPLVRFDTQSILQTYDPEFAKKRVFEPYLLTLSEAWLRDLAYHWKSSQPPGSEELEKTGLLEKIAGGTTLRLGA